MIMNIVTQIIDENIIDNLVMKQHITLIREHSPRQKVLLSQHPIATCAELVLHSQSSHLSSGPASAS